MPLSNVLWLWKPPLCGGACSTKCAERNSAYASQHGFHRCSTQATDIGGQEYYFLTWAKANTAVAHLSHHNSVCLSVTWVDQSKTVQARITKFSPSTARKTLVLKSVKIFHKFDRGHTERGRKIRGGRDNLQFLANKSLNLRNGARWGLIYQQSLIGSRTWAFDWHREQ